LDRQEVTRFTEALTSTADPHQTPTPSFDAYSPLSHWNGYSFDDADWIGVEHGLSTTDVEANRWFQYPLDGTPVLEVSIARDINADPISVEVRSLAPPPDKLQTQIETTLTIFNSFLAT